LYDVDPFAAKKDRDARRVAGQKIREASNSTDNRNAQTSKVRADYPEVIMASSLRELVEDAIKQVRPWG
jgi:ATP-dependent RNA helicase DHX57